MDVRPLIKPGTFSSRSARGRNASTIRNKACREPARGSSWPLRPFLVHWAAIENGWHGGPAAIRSSSPRAIPRLAGVSSLAASSTRLQSDRVQFGRFRRSVVRTTGSCSTQWTVRKPAFSKPRSSPPIPVKRDRTCGRQVLPAPRSLSAPRKATIRFKPRADGRTAGRLKRQGTSWLASSEEPRRPDQDIRLGGSLADGTWPAVSGPGVLSTK